MTLHGKECTAHIKAKKDAKNEFDIAAGDDISAVHVSKQTRDSNALTVAANVKAGQKVEFKLTYEELLERKLGKYQHLINWNPGKIVDDVKVEVFINESLPLKTLKVVDKKTLRESHSAQIQRDTDADTSKAYILIIPKRVDHKKAGKKGRKYPKICTAQAHSHIYL